jgi:DNA-binding CsgD family transcriptional regulator
LRGLEPSLEYALKITYMDSSYCLYVDGEPAASGGEAGRSPEEARPAYAPRVLRLPPGITEAELRLEVANFSHLRGGPFRPILLGEASILEGRDGFDIILTAIAAASLLALGGIFLLNALLRRSASALCFGLAYLMGAAVIFLISGELLAYRLFPGLDFELFFRASAFASYAIPPLVFIAAHELFGGLSDRNALAAAAPGAALALSFLVAPLDISGVLNALGLAATIALLGGALALSIRAAAKGYPHARLIMLGFLFVMENALYSFLFASGRGVEDSFFPLFFLSVFLDSSYGARLAVDLASALSALLAINAISMILFSDSAKRAQAAAAISAEGGPERAHEAFHAIGLSAREEEVACLALAGKRNKEIGDALCISLPTVKTHLSRIFAKAGIKSRSELFAFYEGARSGGAV